MEHMRVIAFETAMRACLFAALAIFCIMVGLSFMPRIAFQTGAFLTAVMALVLVYKARESRTKDYRRTEMWLYLAKEHRPPASYAQRVTATVLAETYLKFARWTGVLAFVLLLLSVLAALMGW
jgi:hypothetical protein